MSSHVALEPTSGLWGWWNSNCSGATPLGGCAVQGAPAASLNADQTALALFVALDRPSSTAPSPKTSCAAGEMPPNAACNRKTRAGSNGKTLSKAGRPGADHGAPLLHVIALLAQGLGEALGASHGQGLVLSWREVRAFTFLGGALRPLAAEA